MTGTQIRTALNARLSKSEVADAINAEISRALTDIAGRDLWPDLHTSGADILAYTTGTDLLADTPDAGDVVTGATSGATGIIAAITVDTGTFVGHDAAGSLHLIGRTGAFTVTGENLTFTDGESAVLPRKPASFIADDKSRPLPSNFRVLDRVFITDDHILQPVRADVLRSYQDLPSATTGEPTRQAIIGDKLFVYPIPDGAYTINCDYWCQPAACQDETLALPFGDEFMEAVITGTIVQYLKSTGFSTHPKLAENQGLFNEQVAMLQERADAKVTITKPYSYC